MGNSLTRRNRVNEAIDLLTTRLINFHHRRITNAADGIDPQDYVTLRQLLEAVNNVVISGAGVHQTEAVTMSATPHNIPDVTVINGNTLTWYITQGAGSHYPAWSVTHYQSMPTVADPTPGTITIVGAVGRGGKWVWDGRLATIF